MLGVNGLDCFFPPQNHTFQSVPAQVQWAHYLQIAIISVVIIALEKVKNALP